MSDEHKLNQATNKAAQVEALLRNEHLTAAFTGLETAYIAAWRVTDARDTDARERLWQAVQVVGKVRDHLTKIMSDGRIAQTEINQIAEKRKRIFGIV